MNRYYSLMDNCKQDQSFTDIYLQYGIGICVNYHIRGDDSDAQLYTTAGGGRKIVGSGYQVL